MFPEYDVIVVGAGHAGCEAAASAAPWASALALTLRAEAAPESAIRVSVNQSKVIPLSGPAKSVSVAPSRGARAAGSGRGLAGFAGLASFAFRGLSPRSLGRPRFIVRA